MKLPKLELCINFQKYNSSFAPASQQRIKRLNQRMERTNTRFKHQSEQFWVAEKTTKGAGRFAPRPPLCFLGLPKFFELLLKSRICWL